MACRCKIFNVFEITRSFIEVCVVALETNIATGIDAPLTDINQPENQVVCNERKFIINEDASVLC